MPLTPPILDNRSYQQLRDELVRRIPVYNPEWTDHNPSDPGITLLELFAFLGENLLFRFNQIPEATRLAFLGLLQIPLRPAASAACLVSFEDPLFAGRTGPSRVDPGTVSAWAGRVAYEISTEVTVAPWRALAVSRTKTAEPTTTEGQEFAQIAIDALELGPDEVPAFYVNQALAEDPSAPDAISVDFGESVDGMIWIAALGASDTLEPLLGKTLNIGFMPDESILVDDAIVPCAGPFGAASSSDGGDEEDVVWEVSSGRFDSQDHPIYRALDVAGDTTRGLRQRGVVRVRLPQDAADIGPFEVEDAALEGTGALPPLLDDPAQRDQTLFWLRAWRRTGQEPFGRVLWLGLNAAEVIQQRRAGTEFLGTGTGQAGQRYRLINPNVVAGSLVLEVEEQPAQWQRWTAVPSFVASREDDRHFVVDLESGEVRFGNGLQGFAPQVGQRVRATEYRYGGGSEGNVAARAISKVEGTGAEGLKVSNPLGATGGAAAEPIAEALERLPGELRRRDRAVTPSDFRELALGTPGADLGRAECLPRYHPATAATDAAGVVSVVIWPRRDARHPEAPVPERSTLRRVCEWLDQRRLVTTELYVIAATYVPIAVSIGIRVKPGYGADAVRAWVDQIIRQYLAALPPYGPEGQGWPLGQRVHAPELEAAVLQVEGVMYLEADGVGVARQVDGSWVEGTVELGPAELPELALLSVVQGPRLQPGLSPTPPALSQTPVPVPTVPEEC